MSEAAMVPKGLLWEEFLDLPDDPAYRHAELIDGEVIVNPPTTLHQLLVGRIWSAIDLWIRAGKGRGEVTMEPLVQVRYDRGYLPDVAWYRQDRCAPPGELPHLEGPPDLAVEVLSPSNRPLDMVVKRADYARIGVQEFWLVDPAGPWAIVLRLQDPVTSPVEFVVAEEVGPGGKLTSPLLPGLSIAMADLVAR